MSNLNIKQILIKRGNTLTISTYTGPHGELILNTDDNSVYVQDGVTQGGHQIGANVNTLNNTIATLQTEIANIAGITGNIAQLESFFANINLQELQNLVYGNANVAVYLPHDDTISAINANILAANAAIITANTALKGYTCLLYTSPSPRD